MIGVDNHVGPYAALDDVDMARLLTALAHGAKPRALAEAYGLDRRTVYRYRHARLEQVQVAGHWFTFLVVPGKRPTLLTQRRR